MSLNTNNNCGDTNGGGCGCLILILALIIVFGGLCSRPDTIIKEYYYNNDTLTKTITHNGN